MRRIIYSVFILAFFIISPIIVLYTNGYRYNFQKGKIEQVGVLFLDTIPADASLYLNNQKLANTRPLRLNNLHPNYYTVKAEKDGYMPWQKDLEVKSQESTLAYDIVLFKRASPIFLEKNNTDTFSLSPENNYIALIKNNEIWLYNLENDINNKLVTLTASSRKAQLTWSYDEKYILYTDLQNPLSAFVIEVAKPTNIYYINKIASGNFSGLTWSASNYLFGLANGSLHQIDFEKLTSTIISSEVKTFTSNDNGVFLTKNTKNNTIVYKYNKINIFKPLEELATLPLETYTINEYNNEIISLQDLKNEIYLIDLPNIKQPLLRLNGISSRWGLGEKNNFLYYYDRSELWIFDPKIKKSYLLNRYDENIQNVIPLNDAPYFLLQLGNKLFISELDDRDKRQSFLLFENKELQEVTIDIEGKNVYLKNKTKDGFGIIKLEIQ